MPLTFVIEKSGHFNVSTKKPRHFNHFNGDIEKALKFQHFNDAFFIETLAHRPSPSIGGHPPRWMLR
jgi:hypothetical protein